MAETTETTSTSDCTPLDYDEISDFWSEKISHELVIVRKNFGYCGLDTIFQMV